MESESTEAIIGDKGAAAQREARRKRILENSNSRLTKITGRNHDDEFVNKINGFFFKSINKLMNK